MALSTACSIEPALDDFVMPEGGLNIRLGDTPILGQEERACMTSSATPCWHFVRANKPQQVSLRPAAARPSIGIITTGKAYLDVRQALDELGHRRGEVPTILVFASV